MEKQAYTLVLPCTLGPSSSYGGGYACGSVIAHWFHLHKGNKGVFWVWPLTSSGMKNEHKFLLNSGKISFGEPLDKEELVTISRKGFFYETNTHSMAWEFEADCIIRSDFYPPGEAEKGLQLLMNCMPIFRQEYLAPLWGDWLLITKLKRIKNPINGEKVDNGFSFPGFKYFSNPEGRIVSLSSSHLRQNAFIVEHPEVESVDPHLENEINSYLKPFLTDNPPAGGLREINVHEIFVMKLLDEGYFIKNEGPVSGGRYDVLFEDKRGNPKAVEFKLREGDPAVDQLQDYIDKLQEEYETKIQGIIVCGQSGEKLENEAKKHGFRVIEYKLSIDIPFKKVIA
jgi:hypothetical protein